MRARPASTRFANSTTLWRPNPTWLPTRHSTTQSSPLSSTTPPRRSFFLLYSSLLTSGIVGGLVLSLWLPRPRIIQILYPEPTPVPHHVESEQGKQHMQQLEKELHELEIVKRMRQEKLKVEVGTEMGLGTSSNVAQTLVKDAAGRRSTQTQTGSTAAASADNSGDDKVVEVAKWTESRPYAATPAGPHSLSGYTLKGPGKFAVAPLVFSSRDKRQAVFVVHVGSGLCGHEGIVHGGLLGTLLDESLGRTALLALPTNIGVTATLELSYRKPTFANQFIVIKTELVDVKGRKAWVKGHIEDLDGQTLVEAKALFVEPKMARFLDNSSVREALK
ncbi:hypothetical protein OIO90_003257 [Microbotryomycetes sp. JL221]|nr:hypothetical protein OIO90_003257 [Microbotryomycetes sp. JL221]